MKKVKVQVETEKKGLFGRKKTVVETKTIEVDNKTYKEMKKAEKEAKKAYNNRPYSIEEMMLYDEIFDD